MKQLEITMRKLCETADTKTAFAIQFQTHYQDEQEVDNS